MLAPAKGSSLRHYPLHSFLAIVVTLSCGLACDRLEEQTSKPAVLPMAESVTVFSAGELGYACFRIPAMVSTPGGIVLAFSEARHTTCRDDADIDLVDCPRERYTMTDAACGVGVFPAEGLGVFGIGVDIAA